MESDGDNREHVMNQNQRLIQESKDKIANLEDELMELPRELARANERLLTETLKVCYSKMNSNHEDIEVLNKWIDATRVKLKKNILIKQDKETNNENMYSLIHDIIGPETAVLLTESTRERRKQNNMTERLGACAYEVYIKCR